MSALLSSLGAVGSVLGSMYNTHQNRKAVESTNQMNLQIARETNQANKDLYQQQFQDQLKMQQMQNEYNSAPAQVQRLRQAGLNPALTFGDSSSVAPLSVPSAHPAQTGAPMQAFTQNYSDSPVAAALSSLSLVTGASKDEQEAKGMRIDNQYRDELIRQQLAEGRQRIEEGIERIKNSKADRKQKAAATRELVAKSVQLDFLNQITESSIGELSKSAELQNQQTNAQIQLLREQTRNQSEQILASELQRVLAVRADSRAGAELASVIATNAARSRLFDAEGRLNEKEVENFSIRVTHDLLNNNILKQQAAQLGVNFEREGDVIRSTVNNMLYRTLQLQQDLENPLQYMFGNSRLSGIIPAVGSGIGGYFIGRGKGLKSNGFDSFGRPNSDGLGPFNYPNQSHPFKPIKESSKTYPIHRQNFWND